MVPKRKMPKRLVTLDLSDDGFEGFVTEAWVDNPVAFSREYGVAVAKAAEKDASPADVNRATDLFLEVFPSWRGFVDWEGKKIPHTRVAIDSIPLDLSQVMWRRRAEALKNGAMPDPLEDESSEPHSEEQRDLPLPGTS